MARRRRMRWRRGLTAALTLGRQGVQSLLEFRYVNRVERPHGLPEGRRQHAVRRGSQRHYQDVEYKDYALVVELDGRDAHPDWSRWADIRRDNANAAAGQVTLRYAWADVTERPCRTAHEVAGALRQRGWEGSVRRCGAACLIPGSISGHGRLGA
jgi:very-short-patch-repair endonuclease